MNLPSTSVKHSKIIVNVCYDCPGCGWHHWLTKTQYKFDGYFVVCDCGESFGILAPKAKSGKSDGVKPIKVVPKNVPTTEKYSKSNIIKFLSSQGFSPTEIGSALKTIDLGSINNGDEYSITIAKIIKQMT